MCAKAQVLKPGVVSVKNSITKAAGTHTAVAFGLNLVHLLLKANEMIWRTIKSSYGNICLYNSFNTNHFLTWLFSFSFQSCLNARMSFMCSSNPRLLGGLLGYCFLICSAFEFRANWQRILTSDIMSLDMQALLLDSLVCLCSVSKTLCRTDTKYASITMMDVTIKLHVRFEHASSKQAFSDARSIWIEQFSFQKAPQWNNFPVKLVH